MYFHTFFKVTEDFKRLQLHRDEHDADSVLTDQNRHKPKLEFAERAATMQAQPVPAHPQAMQAPIQTTSPAKQTITMQAQPVPAHPQVMQAPIQATSPQGQGNASHPTMQAPHGYGYGYGYPVGQPQMPAQDPSLYGSHSQQNPQHNPLYYTTPQLFPYYPHPSPYYGQFLFDTLHTLFRITCLINKAVDGFAKFMRHFYKVN